MRLVQSIRINENESMKSLDSGLYVIIACALAVGVAVPWAWDSYRDHVRRKAAAREEAARQAHAANNDRWWRHNSVSTMPHSRMFESSFEEPGPSLPSQHP